MVIKHSTVYVDLVRLLLGFAAVAHSVLAGQVDHAAVVDAGSSGSRIYVFQWPKRADRFTVARVKEIFSYKVTPGISSYVNDQAGLVKHMETLLDKAAEKVPQNEQATTPIYLMATAGMRLLPEKDANLIMEQIDTILLDKVGNPFQYASRSARILSGEEEGTFAWITVNYLRGYFDDPASMANAGILEMGGASTQIAFIPKGSILADKFPVKIAGVSYPLYVHSYLHFGQSYISSFVEEYLEKKNRNSSVIRNPCMVKEDVINTTVNGREVSFLGIGDADLCYSIIDPFVYQVLPSRCFPKPCAVGSVYQPTLDAQTDFYALGSFAFPMRSFRIPDSEGRLAPGKIMDGARGYCGLNVVEARKVTASKPAFVSSDCLVGIYESILLLKGYRFSPNATSIVAVMDVKGQAIVWPLGALLYEIERRPWTCPPATAALSPAAAPQPVCLPVVISAIIVLFISFLSRIS